MSRCSFPLSFSFVLVRKEGKEKRKLWRLWPTYFTASSYHILCLKMRRRRRRRGKRIVEGGRGARDWTDQRRETLPPAPEEKRGEVSRKEMIPPPPPSPRLFLALYVAPPSSFPAKFSWGRGDALRAGEKEREREREREREIFLPFFREGNLKWRFTSSHGRSV